MPSLSHHRGFSVPMLLQAVLCILLHVTISTRLKYSKQSRDHLHAEQVQRDGNAIPMALSRERAALQGDVDENEKPRKTDTAGVSGPARKKRRPRKVSRKRVILMRHCVRATNLDEGPFYNPLTKISSTASQYLKGQLDDLPKWGVGTRLCTSGGKSIAQGVGMYVQSSFRPTSSSLAVIYDETAQRDKTTAEYLLQGMKKPGFQAIENTPIFDNSVIEECGGNETAWDATYHKEHWANLKMPMGIGLPNAENKQWANKWNSMLNDLQKIIGTGGQYKVTEALKMNQDSLQDPKVIIEACGILKFWAQQFMYSWASGIKWSINVSPEEIFEWSQWIYYDRQVKYPAAELVHKGALIVHDILSHLDTSSKTNETIIYVGHDTDIDTVAEILGLTWHLPSYGKQSTPPNSGYVFTREPNVATVQIEYMYTKFDGRTEPKHAAGQTNKQTIEITKYAKMRSEWKARISKFAEGCGKAILQAIQQNKSRFNPR